MKLAFCGASGTGKSTLAKMWAESQGVPMNPIGARQVAASMGFESPYDVDKIPGMREKFQVELLNQKYEWEKSRPDFVTDRTYFDNLVYSLMHNGKHVNHEYVQKVEEYSDIYDLIVLFPVDVFQDLNDPVRVQDKAYHKTYEWILDKFIYGSRKFYKIHVVNDADPRSRIVSIKQRIKLFNYAWG